MGLVLLLGLTILLIGLITYIRIKNDRDIYSYLTKKTSSKTFQPKLFGHPTQTSTPLKSKTLNYHFSNKEGRNEETTPIKSNNPMHQFTKGCSTLGAVEKEKIRQKLLLSSNKRNDNQFKLLDNENNNHNQIKVLRMSDYLFQNNDIVNNITFDENQKKRNEILFENEENCIMNYVF